MNKKTVKIISILLTVAFVIMALSTAVFATQIGNVDVDPNTNGNGISNVTTTGNTILGTIQVVGILVAVGVLMVLGIKYMTGSAEEKASYKKTMIPYLVGAVLLFGASALAGVIYDFAMGL